MRRLRQLRPHFSVGEKCPHKEVDLPRPCLGNPGREDRIYGAYKESTVASRSVTAIPDSCVVPVSASNCGGEFYPGFGRRSGGDLSFTGVVVQPDPGRKLLSLKAVFMDASFEPVASSDPPRAILANWWRAVSKSGGAVQRRTGLGASPLTRPGLGEDGFDLAGRGRTRCNDARPGNRC